MKNITAPVLFTILFLAIINSEDSYRIVFEKHSVFSPQPAWQDRERVIQRAIYTQFQI